MQTIIFYEVTQNSDRTEGKGITIPTGLGFLSQEDAVAYAGSLDYGVKFGVMGCPGSKHDVRKAVLHIFDDMLDMKNYDSMMRESRKQQALAKLTKEEREALGYA